MSAPAELIETIGAGDRRIGRDGDLRIVLERRGARTVLTECRQRLPLQLLAPLALDDPAAVLSIVNPTGGVLGGDRLTIEVEARPGAHGCLTTPSATKIYRAAGHAARQDVEIRVKRDAIVEWVPDHVIPFADSVFRQSIRAEVDEGGRLVLVDAYAAGRVAREEAWRFGRLESALTIRDDRGWLLLDRFALSGATDPPWSGIGLTDSHPYFVSIVVIADAGTAELVETLRAIGETVRDARVAPLALSRRGVLARGLARTAPSLTEVIDKVWMAARRHLLARGPLALRKA